MDAESWHGRLSSGHWYRHLPAPLQHSLLAHARVRQLTAGQVLFKRGDPPCGLYAVLEGSLRISAVNEQGKEALLSLAQAPFWFGEIAVFDGLLRTHDACAVGPCTLLQVPQAAMLHLLAQSPAYWRDMALLMSQKLRLSFINIEQLSLAPASVRVAHRLWMIAEGYGEIDGSRRVVQLAQEDLAAMLGYHGRRPMRCSRRCKSRGLCGWGMGRLRYLM